MMNATQGILKRTLLAFMAAAAMFIITSGGVSAANTSIVTVKVNGATIFMGDAPAFVSKENYTMVPLRFISEALGAKVSWENKKKIAIVEVSEPDNKKVAVTLNEKDVLIDEKLIVSAGTPATMKSGRVMVPLRVISEGLGATVEYAPKAGGGGTVTITTPWGTPVQASPSAPSTSSNVNSEYTTWTPTANEKVTGPIVFQPLKWDASTRTLSFQLPSTITHGSEVWEVTSGLRENGKKDRKLETGTEHKLVGLREEFMIAININYEPRSVGIDCYFVMSKPYSSKHYGYKGSIDDGLIVYDAHKNMVTLETVYKVLGISN